MTVWSEHEDYPCTITEHHAHEAQGSSSLSGYLRGGGQPAKTTADLGNAVGWLATTDESLWGTESAEVVQRPSFRGKPDGLKTWEQDHPDVIGLAKAEYAKATAMATALREDPYVGPFVTSRSVQVEHTVLAKHRSGVRCKARPDLRLPGVWLGDIKTTRRKDAVDFRYAVSDFGYDLQGAQYHDIEASRYDLECLAGGFELLVVQSDPPHYVSVYPLGPKWMARGRRLYEAAIAVRKIHEETGERPPLWWSGRAELPEPTAVDRLRERRMLEHVQRLTE